MASINDQTHGTAGRTPVVFMGDINENDSTDRTLFSLPANSVIIGGSIIGQYTAASNATSGLISVGVAPGSGGTGTEFLNGFSVVGSQGSNFVANVPFARFGSQASNTWTGSSSNKWTVGSNSFDVSGKVTGTIGAGAGPWTVVFFVVTV